HRRGDQAFADGELACCLATTADGLGLLTRALFRGLLVSAPRPHFAEHAFALHFLFQDPEGLLDVVVAYQNLQWLSFFSWLISNRGKRRRRRPKRSPARRIPQII